MVDLSFLCGRSMRSRLDVQGTLFTTLSLRLERVQKSTCAKVGLSCKAHESCHVNDDVNDVWIDSWDEALKGF